MAQQLVTTSGPNGTGISLSTLSVDIIYLQGRMAAGHVIYAADIQLLQTLYNSFVNHYHTASDTAYIAYGNTFAYPTTTTTSTSGVMLGAPAVNYTYTASTKIQAAPLSVLASAFNSIRTHVHNIQDYTLP